MNNKKIQMYNQIAQIVAQQSHCVRKKVGALLVSSEGNNILSYAYNGSPSGFDNCCEDHDGLTKSTTIHAELNAIAKAAKLGHSTKDSILFVTLSPCVNCAVLLLQSGISEIYYSEAYKDLTGLELLSTSGITCHYIGK
jgi:dCMP deaminase